jgi:tRNA U34 5-methylaminomethyl-2-thiouridine-forming methyltransferase MnmC
MNEHFHSMHGAVQESKHVFIKMGLNTLIADEIKILEMGFGTGLNALLTLIESNALRKIYYHAVELFPLPLQTVESLEFPRFLGLTGGQNDLFGEMQLAQWNTDTWIQPEFCLRKIKASLLDIELPANYNLIYFDAFAPGVQPELWSETVFRKMYGALQDEGILVTYCAKGEVRRNMQRAGFEVERLPGAPGKREMLRARKVGR